MLVGHSFIGSEALSGCIFIVQIRYFAIFSFLTVTWLQTRYSQRKREWAHRVIEQGLDPLGPQQ